MYNDTPVKLQQSDPLLAAMEPFNHLPTSAQADLFYQLRHQLIDRLRMEIEEYEANIKQRHEAIAVIRDDQGRAICRP